MSRRPLTFAIKPTNEHRPVSRTELIALAEELGLTGDDRVRVTVVGNELRIILTPLGEQALKEAASL